MVKAAGGSCRDDPVIATNIHSRRLLPLPRYRVIDTRPPPSLDDDNNDHPYERPKYHRAVGGMNKLVSPYMAPYTAQLGNPNL